jgi:hypothetical protein
VPLGWAVGLAAAMLSGAVCRQTSITLRVKDGRAFASPHLLGIDQEAQ